MTLRTSVATGAITAIWSKEHHKGIRGLPSTVHIGERGWLTRADRRPRPAGVGGLVLPVGCAGRRAARRRRRPGGARAGDRRVTPSMPTAASACSPSRRWRRAGHVTVIESSKSACFDAKHNLAERAGGGSATDRQVGGRAAGGHRPIDRSTSWSPIRPGPGLGKPGVAVLTAGKPPVLVLVSCDPVSLARDVTLMAANGYRARVRRGARPVPEHAARRDGHPLRARPDGCRGLGSVRAGTLRACSIRSVPTRSPPPWPMACRWSRSSRRSSPTSACRRRPTVRRSNAARRRSATAGRSRRSPRCSTARCGSGCPTPNTSGSSGRPARWPSATSRWRSPSAGSVGASTVSASVAIAAAAGVSVFATGGIGGVHRGSELTGDISADLDALAHHRGRHGVGRGEGVPRSRPVARVPRDRRRARARLAARLVPGVLHPLVRPADPAPGRVGRRGRPASSRRSTRPGVGRAARRADPRGRRTRRRAPRPRARRRRSPTVTRPASPARRSRRSCSAASPRRPTGAASRPTSRWPRTTPASPPRSPSPSPTRIAPV